MNRTQREVNYDKAWVTGESCNITSGYVGGLFDCPQPPRAVKRAMPNEGFDGQRSGHEVGTININGDKAIEPRENFRLWRM